MFIKRSSIIYEGVQVKGKLFSHNIDMKIICLFRTMSQSLWHCHQHFPMELAKRRLRWFRHVQKPREASKDDSEYEECRADDIFIITLKMSLKKLNRAPFYVFYSSNFM